MYLIQKQLCSSSPLFFSLSISRRAKSPCNFPPTVKDSDSASSTLEVIINEMGGLCDLYKME